MYFMSLILTYFIDVCYCISQTAFITDHTITGHARQFKFHRIQIFKKFFYRTLVRLYIHK
ncbi:hypothetical protein A9C11_18185 [Pseudomonas citronellolis]|uniref:Uncharacterized protein n=1 Tax=Pseudomonas citronellolis TaxID=53408 RepID=A0A1A9KEC0_9PSED|nr:hypothetical protein A9C11_18185 [Pseudomonas citronellolis]